MILGICRIFISRYLLRHYGNKVRNSQTKHNELVLRELGNISLVGNCKAISVVFSFSSCPVI